MTSTHAPRARTTVWAVRLAAAVACILILASVLRPLRPSAAAPSARTPIEIRLGYFPNLAHAQAVLAVDSGELAAALAPDRLITRTFNAGPPLIESLFAGEIDIGYVGPSPAVNAFIQSRGRGIRVIAGAAADGVVIIARAGSDIHTLADLKDRRIATPQLGNTQDISARHYVMTVLGQDRSDNVIPVPNAEQAGMMARRQIDAAWSVEPWASRLVLDSGGTIIAEEKDLWPQKTFSLALVVVAPEFLAKHPDMVARFLQVHCSWTSRLAAAPQPHAPRLADAIARLTGKRLPDAVIAQAIGRVRYTDEPLPESIRTFAERAARLGLLRGIPDINVLVDTALLRRVKTSGQIGDPPPKPAPPATTAGSAELP